jgi:hypothetical protein
MEGGLEERDRFYYGVGIDDDYSILLTGTVKSAFGVLALVVCGFVEPRRCAASSVLLASPRPDGPVSSCVFSLTTPSTAVRFRTQPRSDLVSLVLVVGGCWLVVLMAW